MGGIGGWASRILIRDSLNGGHISGNGYVGGVLGYGLHDWKIVNCKNTGSYSGNGIAIDGIAGNVVKDDKIENCVDERRKD